MLFRGAAHANEIESPLSLRDFINNFDDPPQFRHKVIRLQKTMHAAMDHAPGCLLLSLEGDCCLDTFTLGLNKGQDYVYYYSIFTWH